MRFASSSPMTVSFSGSNRSARPSRASANLRLVVGDPVPHFKLQHLALAIRFETERRVQRIWRLLVVLKHEVSAHRSHVHGKRHSLPPTVDINFMDGLIPDFAISCVPDPVPVVVKPVFRKRLHR